MGSRAKTAVLVVLIVCIVLIATLILAWQKLQENIFAPIGGAAKPELRVLTGSRRRKINEDHVEGLALWVVEAEEDSPVIIFFHGSFGNMGHSSLLIELLSCFDCNVVAFDYSGYGSSEGRCSTEQIIEDGMLVYGYARKRWRDSEIILWGHSLGTSVATYVASRQECRALVLMAPFYGLAELGRDVGGVFHLAGIVYSPLVNLLPTNEWIRRVTCPVAIIHSLRDKLISYRHALMLYEELLSARQKRRGSQEAVKSLLLVPTAGNHCCTLLTEWQLKKLSDFLGLQPKFDACLRLLEEAKKSPDCTDC